MVKNFGFICITVEQRQSAARFRNGIALPWNTQPPGPNISGIWFLRAIAPTGPPNVRSVQIELLYVMNGRVSVEE